MHINMLLTYTHTYVYTLSTCRNIGPICTVHILTFWRLNCPILYVRIFFRTNFNAHFNMNMYVTLSSTCFGPWHAHPQEDTRCCVCAVVPPEDGHVKARNMSRIMWHTCSYEGCIKVGSKKYPILWCTVGKTSNCPRWFLSMSSWRLHSTQ